MFDMRIAIVGSRDFSDYNLMEAFVLSKYNNGSNIPRNLFEGDF